MESSKTEESPHQKSPKEYQIEVTETHPDTISIVDTVDNPEYMKKNVCLPYFKDIFKDLASRSNDKHKGVNKVSMLDYIDLPGILAERFFQVIDSNKDGFLDINEFVSGMFKIYYSEMETKIKFVFDIDGYISKDDIKTVLCYVPINKILADRKIIRREGKFTQEGGGKVQSQEEIEMMLQYSFGEREKISYADFVKINHELSSDMFLTVITVLKDKLPCSENLWRYERNLKNFEESKIVSSPSKSPHVLASPKVLSKFSPLSPLMKSSPTTSGKKGATQGQQLLKYAVSNQQIARGDALSPTGGPKTEKQELDEQTVTNSIPISKFRSNQLSKMDTTTKSYMLSPDNVSSPYLTSAGAEAVRLPNISMLNTDHPKSFNDFVMNRQDEIMSPTVYLGDKKETNYCTCGMPCDIGMTTCNNCVAKEVIKMEGEVLKKTGENKLKKYWLSLENKELYFYKTKDETKHKGMHSLVGVFVKEELEEILDKKTILYSFKLIFPNKSRVFYVMSKTEKDAWITAIKKAVGYANLYDFYDMKEKLGKGKFGLVRAAIHKKTGKRVAVKIMKKKEMNTQDVELLKREIEILKICQHPNIIRLLDIFENQDYIYIVMELLKGGDLFTYLEKRNFKVTEERACKIVHSLATSIFYLHSYGITHRDLKPENILMVDDSEIADVKLVDFGLSKIIGPSETCNEPFGTLSYVAPEVLLQQPYGKAVDIWSVGVITYLLLSGTLPFDDDDDREIARQTIYEPADYTYPIWNKVSKEARNFVEKLLVKDPKKRLPLEQVLEHPWLVKNAKDLREMRRKSVSDRVSKFKVFSHAAPDSPKIIEEIERRAKEDDFGGY